MYDIKCFQPLVQRLRKHVYSNSSIV